MIFRYIKIKYMKYIVLEYEYGINVGYYAGFI